MLNVLTNAGLDHQSAERLYATIHTYTIGFAALEASRSQWTSTNKTDDATMTRLASFTTTDQFVAGTELLLRGVATLPSRRFESSDVPPAKARGNLAPARALSRHQNSDFQFD